MADYTDYISYTESNVRSKVPAKGGVYKISVEKSGDSSKVIPVYVGKSNDLQERLIRHLSDQEQNACLKKKIKGGKAWISWTEIGREADRTTEETARIKQFSPECNIQQNS